MADGGAPGRSAPGLVGASVWHVPGWFARIPHGWTRTVAQLGAPSSALAVLDAVAELYAGPAGGALRAKGAPLTVRLIAERYGLHKTHVQRGLTWAGGPALILVFGAAK